MHHWQVFYTYTVIYSHLACILDQSCDSIVKMALGQLMCFVLLFSATVSSYSRLTCVIPTTIIEELTPSLSNCPGEASQNLTFNELISGSFNRRNPFSSFEDVIFLEGKHIVNSTPSFLLANGVKNFRMRGHNNVVIVCEQNFYLYFSHINGAITITNLQFENCIGKLGQYRPTLYFRTLSTGWITIANIKIINDHENGEGIVVDPESTLWFKVSVHNSFFSTRGTGFYSAGFISMKYTNRIKPKGSIQISNTTFLDLCIELQTSDILYTITNTSFSECKCSPVLSFHGHTRRETATLRDVQVKKCGGSSSNILWVSKLSVILEGIIIFHDNAGTSILNLGSNLIINGANVTLINNHAFNGNRPRSKHAGTILLVSNSIVSINHGGKVLFQDNYGQTCGGITLIYSGRLLLFGNSTIDFINNIGDKGGVLSLYRESSIRFATLEGNIIPNSVSTISLNFVFNSAMYGGAIYVEDQDYIDPFSHNFTRSIFVLFNFEDNATLHFAKNTASFGGDNVYGGWIGVNNHDGNILDQENIVFEVDSENTMTSDPIRICKCTDSIPNCTITEELVELFPGQTLTLEIVAVGHGYSTVKTFVSATFYHQLHHTNNNSNGDAWIRGLQKIQDVERRCTLVNYTIFSNNKEEILILSPIENSNIPNLDSSLSKKDHKLTYLFKQFSITLSIKNCPLAFHLDNSGYYCTCLSSFSSHNLKCDNQLLKIIRNQQQWVGLTYTHTIPEEHPGIIAHQHCLYDYCRSDEISLSISMEYKCHQCAFNHSGILCGACKLHFSQVFGSSKCRQYSNNRLILAIFPGTLLAGLALVAFLIVFNLTVLVETINSIIFYANVI